MLFVVFMGTYLALGRREGASREGVPQEKSLLTFPIMEMAEGNS